MSLMHMDLSPCGSFLVMSYLAPCMEIMLLSFVMYRINDQTVGRPAIQKRSEKEATVPFLISVFTAFRTATLGLDTIIRVD